MKFEVKIRKISQELCTKTIGSVVGVRKSLEKMRKVQSFGINIIPSEENAIAVIALTHGKETVENLINKKSTLNKIIINTMSSKLGLLFDEYKQVRVNILYDALSDLIASPESKCLTNDYLEGLLDSIKVTSKEKEIFFSNLKLSEKENKLYSNHTRHLSDLFILLNLSFIGNNQDILAKTVVKLVSENQAENFEDKEAEINIAIANKLKTFMEVNKEQKEINMTKFLKILEKKKMKKVYNVDFYDTHSILEQKKTIKITSKYLLLKDGSKVLLNKIKGVELKYYDDRVELYKNSVLLKVSYIVKPSFFEEKLNQFLGFKTSLKENESEQAEQKTEEAISSSENIL